MTKVVTGGKRESRWEKREQMGLVGKERADDKSRDWWEKG